MTAPVSSPPPLYDFQRTPSENFVEAKTKFEKLTKSVYQQHISPALGKIQAFTEEKPLLATFAALFIALSLIPTIVFVSFSVLVATLFIGVAVFWSLVFISSAAFLLLISSCFSAGLAVLFTGFIATAYLGCRLLYSISLASTVTQGVKNFKAEMMSSKVDIKLEKSKFT